jgi:hypothetical protein
MKLPHGLFLFRSFVFAIVVCEKLISLAIAWTPLQQPLVQQHSQHILRRSINRVGYPRYSTTTIKAPKKFLQQQQPYLTTFLKSRNEKNSPNDDDDDSEEWSDFDDLGYDTTNPSPVFVPGDDDTVDLSSIDASQDIDFAMLLQEKQQAMDDGRNRPWNSGNTMYVDYTAIRTRQFTLGQDMMLTDYVGTMGFQEVTDWEYYYPDEDNSDERRQVVQPSPLDSSKYVGATFLSFLSNVIHCLLYL